MQLAEHVGRSKAIELVLLSEPISAEQMVTWNIANRAVEDGTLDQQVEALAARLAAGSPRGLRRNEGPASPLVP